LDRFSNSLKYSTPMLTFRAGKIFERRRILIYSDWFPSTKKVPPPRSASVAFSKAERIWTFDMKPCTLANFDSLAISTVKQLKHLRIYNTRDSPKRVGRAYALVLTRTYHGCQLFAEVRILDSDLSTICVKLLVVLLVSSTRTPTREMGSAKAYLQVLGSP
jgi:hypothetical protein